MWWRRMQHNVYIGGEKFIEGIESEKATAVINPLVGLFGQSLPTFRESVFKYIR